MKCAAIGGLGCALLGVGIWCGAAAGQVSTGPRRPLAENVIVPQARMVMPPDRPGRIEITEVVAQIDVIDQASTTVLDISLRNTGNRRQEAELMVPVPDGAVVRGFTFQGAGKEPVAEVLPRAEARSTYDAIVAKVRDPALLEFISYNLIRSSVFPVEANGTQKVRLTYEHLLPIDGERIDYFLPRTESIEYGVPWRITASIQSKRPISTVYSPSHKLEVSRKSETHVVAGTAPDASTVPGPFRLSCLLQRNGVTASLFAYPDARTGGGYFLLLAGLPADMKRREDNPAMKREVTLVLDRSGSMSGEKIEQVREAARQIVSGLEPGELFNIITYNESISPFATNPVVKSDETVRQAHEFLKAVTARGGTNIYDALTEALRQTPTPGSLPIVLFLTDGLPTVGQTSEVAIRELATRANPHHRRIFTFGVGFDVNTPLLEKIAWETRAKPGFVLPKEDVEVKVSQLFKQLVGPVLADPRLVVRREPDDGRVPVLDVLPAGIPDLFETDQLVVLGRYIGEKPLQFALSGNYRGTERRFSFSFDVDKASTKNGFVPRLWASRRIAVLIDAIRSMGADGGPAPIAPNAVAVNPKLKELVDEIVRLSTEFGILTEYTAFLAREGTDLSNLPLIEEAARANLEQRAMKDRVGMSSVNQSFNGAAQRQQKQLNVKNTYYDKNLNQVDVSSVQQLNGDAYYKRGDRWIDSKLVQRGSEAKPARVVTRDSKEFRELSDRLARENREAGVSLKGEVLVEVDREAVLVK